MGSTGTKRRAASRPHAILPPSPWARVQRVQLVRREVREYIPPGAVTLLLARADCVVEGGGEVGAAVGAAQLRTYATVMVTIDLGGSASLFREPPDDATAQHVAELIEASAAVASQLIAMARPELSRIAGVPADALEISLEHKARADGSRILIDGDAMAVRRRDAPSVAN